MRGVAGDASDVVVLQFWETVAVVGLRNIRKCDARDCQQLFIKTYRRTFCSERCQKRANKRIQRALERQEAQQQEEQRARLRRRMKGRQ